MGGTSGAAIDARFMALVSRSEPSIDRLAARVPVGEATRAWLLRGVAEELEGAVIGRELFTVR